MSEISDRCEPAPETRTWAAGALLALLPAISFGLQYWAARGHHDRLFQHLTVTYVDWIFVPFNLLVVHVIDWRRGATLFAVTVVAVVANTTAHAFWQSYLSDPGHMFSADRQVLPSGWIHLIYSTLQMILFLAFVFARRADARFLRTSTILAVIYLLAAGTSGYVMNHGFMPTDVVMTVVGLIGVLALPRWIRSAPEGRVAQRAASHVTVEV